LKFSNSFIAPAKIISVFALSFPLSVSSAQDFGQKVAQEICNCIGAIETIDSLEVKLDSCAYAALESVFDNASEELQELYSTDEAVDEVMKKAMEILLSECPDLRKLIIAERKKLYYTPSDSDAANSYYLNGNKAYGEKDYKGAIKLYAKALRKDPDFIFALDNTGLAYRQLEENKKAVKYYLKSLEIYPEGSFALQNLGVAYTFLNQLPEAMDCYEKLAWFYPEDPEGYFGIGKVYILAEEYEKAIDYIFIAHKIYTYSSSEYAKETEKIALKIYDKLKEQNKLELFKEKADEYGITINI